MIRRPAARKRFTAPVGSLDGLRRNREPALARRTLGFVLSTDPAVSQTEETPAASAARRIIPTLAGSWTPSRTRTGPSPSPKGASLSSSPRSSTPAIPGGEGRGEIHASNSRDTETIRAPASRDRSTSTFSRGRPAASSVAASVSRRIPGDASASSRRRTPSTNTVRPSGSPSRARRLSVFASRLARLVRIFIMGLRPQAVVLDPSRYCLRPNKKGRRIRPLPLEPCSPRPDHASASCRPAPSSPCRP